MEFFPDLRHDDVRTAMLTSALGDLNDDDFRKVIKYAEFRKARQTLEKVKRKRSNA